MKVQHYYPFGMLMPGRYVSDTTGKCMTISQTKWVTTIVDSCMDITIYPPSTEGSGGYEITPWGDVVLTIPGPGDAVGFNVNGLVPGVAQDIVLNFTDIHSGTAYVQVIEQVNGVPIVLGSLSTSIKGIYSVKVTPTTQTSVDVVVHGPVEGTMGQLCHKIPKLKQETMLVDVCNDVKDRYRFGFNGQEKVNEWAGIGNHNTAEFWEYDTRTGRRLNLDPVVKPWESGYATFYNSPVMVADPDGKDGIVGGTGTETDPLIIKANYYYSGLRSNEEKAFINAIKQYNREDPEHPKGQVWKISTTEGDIFVQFELKAIKKDNDFDAQDARHDDRKAASDESDIFHFGNSVGIGNAGEGHMGNSTHDAISLDRSRVDQHMTTYPSKSPETDIVELMTSIFVHELGHNLTGNHGDPGSYMDNQAPTQSTTDAAGNTVVNGTSGLYRNSVNKVDENAVKAIIGRIGVPYQTIQSKYLSEKENKRVQKAADRDLKESKTSGTIGRLNLVK